MTSGAGPLDGLTVLDFSTLLPGPLATHWLWEAGARVVKIERPPEGDEFREFPPAWGSSSVNYALLNAGKEVVLLDLKSPADRERLDELVATADILVEQFRPGVMARLGLAYDDVRRRNPGVVYCSITGYGQTGPRAQMAAHDLNYVAETGVLALTDPPHLPTVLTGDLGGGSFPALANVLLALVRRQRTGEGCHLDIAMAENLFPWMYWGLGNGRSGRWPVPSGERSTGGSPRYNLYRTADGRHLAAAPLEDRFWQTFCAIAGLDHAALDRLPPAEAYRRVAAAIAARTAREWEQAFAGRDVCVTVVRTLEEATRDPHFIARGALERGTVRDGAVSMPAMASPIAAPLRRAPGVVDVPSRRPGGRPAS